MSDLKKESIGACVDALRNLEFRSKGRGSFLRPGPTDSVQGWLGLNLATWDLPLGLLVAPVIGVRHIPLEKALVKLAGRTPPIASVSSPLGYLMPESSYRQWEFRKDGVLSEIAEDMAAAVATYGMPFINRWSDWGVFSSEIETSGLLLDAERPVLMPLVFALNGRVRQATELVKEELSRIENQPDMRSQSYREYARRFLIDVQGDE